MSDGLEARLVSDGLGARLVSDGLEACLMRDGLDARLRAALDGKAKPVGALGRIEDLAVQLGLVQGTVRPVVADPVVLVFAGDHGAVASGVSAYPSAVTAAMVGAYLAGRAAINVVSAQVGARLVVVDAGVDAVLPAHPDLVAAKIGPGTRDWTQGPAMSSAEVAAAFAAAAGIVDGLADGGTTVLALGEMGIGNTASAALLVHKVAGLPLLVGRGAGLDDAGLGRKRVLVEAASDRVAGRLDATAALAAFGGFEIAMLVGAMLRAAQRRVVVLVDGVIVTAAAVLAHAMAPGCLDSFVFAHRSAEPGHAAMLAHLGAQPLLDLGMRLGEGTGAALAIPLLKVAAGVLGEMAELSEVA